jgi:hypothetical protein
VRNVAHWRFATISVTIATWLASYEELKRAVAAQIVGADPESQDRYAVAKTDFIERVVGLAVSRGYPQGLPDQ